MNSNTIDATSWKQVLHGATVYTKNELENRQINRDDIQSPLLADDAKTLMTKGVRNLLIGLRQAEKSAPVLEAVSGVLSSRDSEHPGKLFTDEIAKKPRFVHRHAIARATAAMQLEADLKKCPSILAYAKSHPHPQETLNKSVMQLLGTAIRITLEFTPHRPPDVERVIDQGYF